MNIADRVAELARKTRELQEENEQLRRENMTLKAQHEAKDAELNRVNDRLIEREQELAEIGRQIDELLG